MIVMNLSVAVPQLKVYLGQGSELRTTANMCNCAHIDFYNNMRNIYVFWIIKSR